MKKSILKKEKKVNRSKGGDASIMIFLLLFAAVQLIPILFSVFSAFKPLNELYLVPPRLFVVNPTLDNFSDLFKIMGNSRIVFTRYIYNSLFVTIVGIFLTVIFASLAAYPLAKMKQMPGVKFLSWFIILALMLSPDVSGMTSFLLMNKLKLINTYWSIIIPAVATAFNVFLLKQFIEQMVPDSLLEAAKVDGASEFKTWYGIILPIIKPALFTLVIFSMQSLWNNQGTTIYNEELKTLPYVMQQIIAGGIARTGVASAVGVFILIVPVVSFIILQGKVIETMSASGIKD